MYMNVSSFLSSLIKMKQKEKERIQKELENQPDPDQPPGHQRMPEEERLNTLELLNKGINS